MRTDSAICGNLTIFLASRQACCIFAQFAGGRLGMTTLCRLSGDENGFVISIELILIATILVIGLIAGLTALRDAIVSELSDVAGAVQGLNQSYSLSGVTGQSASTAGSDFRDHTDFCDSAGDVSGQPDNCIAVFGVAREF
jgi:Flp pilus assembly pilin Flp